MTDLNRNEPYNNLPLLPPKAGLETTKMLRKQSNPEGHWQNLMVCSKSWNRRFDEVKLCAAV